MANAKRRSVIGTSPRRVNVRFDAADHELLMIHCLRHRVRPGAYLAELVRQNCHGWHIRANPTRAAAVEAAASGEGEG